MYTLEDDSYTPNNNYTATTATGTANNQSHNNGVYNQNGLVWEWAQPQSSMVAEEDHTPNLLLMHENGLANLPQPHTTNLSCTPNSFLNSDHISLNPNWGLQAFEQARFARSTPFGSATLFSAVSGLSNNNTTNQSYLVGYGGQPDLGLMANHMISAPNSTAMTETEESRVFNDYMKCGLNVGDFNSRLGLNLGGRMYFDDILAPLLSFGKRPRPNSVTLTQPPLCQVEGCKGDLTLAKHYHRRHKVCDFHSKSPTVVVSGTTQRFCQQCSRFHSLTEFDEGKRSCRKRLADHNRRRRKPQPNSSSNPTPANSKDALTNEEVKRVKPAGLALTQSEVHASSSNIVAVADPDTALDSKEQLSLSLDKKIKEQKMVQYIASKPPNLSLSTSLPSPPLGQPLGGLHLDPSVDPWQIQSTPNCNGLLLFTPDHIAQQRENPTLHNASNITTTTSTTATTTTTNNNNMAFSALPTADSPCDDHLTKNYCSSTSDWSTIKGFNGHLNDEFDSPQLSLQGSSEMRHHVLSLLEERQVEQKASTIISLDQHHHSHNHHHLLPPQQHLAEQQVSGHDNDNHLFFPTNNTTSVNNQPDHFKNLGLQAWRPFNKLIYNAANDDRI